MFQNTEPELRLHMAGELEPAMGVEPMSPGYKSGILATELCWLNNFHRDGTAHADDDDLFPSYALCK